MILSNITDRGTLRGVIYRGAGSGTTDYTQLTNKPAIDGNILIGDQSAHELGLANLSDIPSVITSYNELSDKPQINGYTLSGDQTAHDLGLANLSDIPSASLTKDLLFQDANHGSSALNTNIYYDNNYKLNDYDLILIAYANTDDSDPAVGVCFCPTYINKFYYNGYYCRYNLSQFENEYFIQLNAGASNEGTGQIPHVYQIVGIKFN